jgi:para-aminobenzoate synthetase component I
MDYSGLHWVDEMNRLGEQGVPFFFVLDFELQCPRVHRLDQLPPGIACEINGVRFGENYLDERAPAPDFSWEVSPVHYDHFLEAFTLVQKEISLGNSYLLNLTFPSRVKTNLSIRDIYRLSRAKYKLLLDDRVVVFSPECFVKIKNHKVYSYPMKGTIEANIPHAKEQILSDSKEMAEHATIVDLIRNDISRVAMRVEVSRYRYIERIHTNKVDLYQVSSEVTGVLPEGYQQQLGSIFLSLLPAGSISGAPKKKTLEIIRRTEGSQRGYYTGVFGYFDGVNIDSGVMIRYVEYLSGELVYRSGGGITSLSNPKKEYNELKQKVYVPLL